MKNIAVLSVLVIIIGMSTARISAYCQDSTKERSYVLALGTHFGFVHGLALEYVYPEPGTTMGELLSELRWDMKPVFYSGIQLDFNRRDLMSWPGFFASTSFKAGFPGDSGIMEDRDWTSNKNNDLTHFSSHTNRTVEFYWLDITLGASCPVKQYFFLKTFISGSWMHFSFSGRDGEGIYPGRPEPLPFEGEVIRYKQDWFLIAAGFSIGTKILSPLSFNLSFLISPFTYCVATDEHLITKTTYKDFTGWGLFLEPRGNISISLKNMDFSIELAYRYIGKTTGPSYYKIGNGNFYEGATAAGAGLSLLDARFIVRILI